MQWWEAGRVGWRPVIVVVVVDVSDRLLASKASSDVHDGD